MTAKVMKTLMLAICVVFVTAMTGCSTVGNLTGGALGSSGESAQAQPSAASVNATSLPGVIVAVKPIKVEVDSNGIVKSALSDASARSSGLASSAIRSSTGYSGIMGMLGGVASTVAGKAVDMVSDKIEDTQREDGVLLSIKLDAGPTIPIKQAGDAGQFHIGDRVVVQQTPEGSVSVKHEGAKPL